MQNMIGGNRIAEPYFYPALRVGVISIYVQDKDRFALDNCYTRITGTLTEDLDQSYCMQYVHY